MVVDEATELRGRVAANVWVLEGGIVVVGLATATLAGTSIAPIADRLGG